jgi:hypothetical protein
MLQAEMKNGTKYSFQWEWVICQTYLATETKSCVPGALLRQYTSLHTPPSHNFHYCGFGFINHTVIKKSQANKEIYYTNWSLHTKSASHDKQAFPQFAKKLGEDLHFSHTLVRKINTVEG